MAWLCHKCHERFEGRCLCAGCACHSGRKSNQCRCIEYREVCGYVEWLCKQFEEIKQIVDLRDGDFLEDNLLQIGSDCRRILSGFSWVRKELSDGTDLVSSRKRLQDDFISSAKQNALLLQALIREVGKEKAGTIMKEINQRILAESSK